MTDYSALKIAPKQARSQAMEEKFLDAIQELLMVEGKSFEEIKIEDLTSRVGCTHGAFYNLFVNKQALLRHFYTARVADQYFQIRESAMSSENCRGMGAWEVIYTYLKTFMEALTLIRPVTLPLFRLKKINAEIAKVTDKSSAVGKSTYNVLMARLYECGAQITHKDPMWALKVIDVAATLAIRERVYYGSLWSGVPDVEETDLRLIETLTDSYVATLFPEHARKQESQEYSIAQFATTRKEGEERSN